jgi:DNA segregation ATPase FtsK/SpoIIIE-like protein
MKIIKVKDTYYNLNQYQSYYFHEGTFVLQSYSSGENNGKSIDLGCEERFSIQNSLSREQLEKKFDEFLYSDQNMIDFSNEVSYGVENSELESDVYFGINELDPMFVDSARLVVINQQGSASLIQRKLQLGYNRAGIIVDQLEVMKILGPFQGSNPREVLFSDIESLDEFLRTKGII